MLNASGRLHSTSSSLLELIQAYEKSLVTSERHSLMPLIDFFNDMAQSETLDISIRHNGIMNFVLKLYATGFHDPCRLISYPSRPLLENACNSLLLTILSGENEVQMISDHPLFVVWTARNNLPFIDEVSNRGMRRIEVWNASERLTVQVRLLDALNSLSGGMRTDAPALYDAYVDALELSA